MKTGYFSRALLVGTMLASASAASAVVVTSLPGGTAIAIPAIDLATNSSTALGNGITFTSNVGSILGKTTEMTFGNGSFEADHPYLSLGAAAYGYNYATMSLTFDTPTSGFLADLRWTNGGPEIGNLGYVSASIAAYTADGTQIGVIQFNNNGYSTPAFNYAAGTYGFLRPTADIARIDFNNAFMGARDLKYIAPDSAAPEPGTWAMSIAGFGLLGGMLRRPRGAVVHARAA